MANFVRLSDTYGINLDHIIAWQDFPAHTWVDGSVDEPVLSLVTTAASENEHGQRQPHEIRLFGEERLTLLHWLEQGRVPDHAHAEHA